MSDLIEKIKKRIEARKWKITDDAFVPELIGMQYANNMNDWCLEIIDEESAKEPQEQPIEQFKGLELANIAVALKQLQYYEDLAEKGLLVELPCKIGDTVWCINKNNKQPYCETVGYFYIDENGISFLNDYEDSNYEFGKDAFFTQSEAEQALADIK